MGGLSLASLIVTGGSYFQGNVGIGVLAPTESLEVNGGVKVGNSTNTNAGTIRWTGTDFEGYNGTEWKSLTAESITTTVVVTDATECADAGGDWQDAQNICYFSGTSCASGWTPTGPTYFPYQYNSTLPKTCNAGYGPCTTGAHTRTKLPIEECWYEDGGNGVTCSALISETGCTKI